MMTIELAAHDRYAAFMFSFGCALGEGAYVSLCLLLMDRLLRFRTLLKVLGWITFGILIVLATATFISALKGIPNPIRALPMGLPFVTGLTFMLLNPIQIPFWLGWITILLERRTLDTSQASYTVFVGGTLVGAVIASILFIVTGSLLDSWIREHHLLWQSSLGLFFIVTAGYQLRMNLARRLKPVGRPKFTLLTTRKSEGRMKSPAT